MSGCPGSGPKAASDGGDYVRIDYVDPNPVNLSVHPSFLIRFYYNNKTGGELKALCVIRRSDNSSCVAYSQYLHDILPNNTQDGGTFIANVNLLTCTSNGDYDVYVYLMTNPGNVVYKTSNKVIVNFTGSSTGSNPNPILLVQKARDMLTGCPSFYEPPSWFNNYEVRENSTGSVAWTSTGLSNNNKNETKNSYICRLNKAKENNPLNWLGYLCTSFTVCNNSSHSGIPFPYDLPNFPPNHYNYYSQTCQAGFVCYSFIYATAKDAGYQLPFNEPISVSNLDWYEFVSPTNRKIGDIILYDFNGDNSYDHAAIITEVNQNDIKNDKVISAFGYSEHFKWGAKETKLWDFHSTNTNPAGIFTSFDPNNPNGPGKWLSDNDVWNTNTININYIKIRRLR